MTSTAITKELKLMWPSEKLELLRMHRPGRRARSKMAVDVFDEAEAEARFRQRLLDDGLVLEFKPLSGLPKDDWIPIRAKGKPLSEIIIEERR
jgi:hypothetical protein